MLRNNTKSYLVPYKNFSNFSKRNLEDRKMFFLLNVKEIIKRIFVSNSENEDIRINKNEYLSIFMKYYINCFFKENLLRLSIYNMIIL